MTDVVSKIESDSDEEFSISTKTLPLLKSGTPSQRSVKNEMALKEKNGLLENSGEETPKVSVKQKGL